jgi:hypothetical protein
MWIYAGINNLRASQARVSANDFIPEVENLFDLDYSLEREYHTILNGKACPTVHHIELTGSC